MTRWATFGLMHRSKGPYSIISSARASRVGGISIPSAFAVWRLMVTSNLVGCLTGRSADLAPLRIQAESSRLSNGGSNR